MANTTKVDDTMTGVYFGWYNHVTKFTRKGKEGFVINEVKGELTIYPGGEVDMGDSNHSYQHYQFDKKLSNRLTEANDDGEDAYEILEECGWEEGEQEFILVHHGEKPELTEIPEE